MFIKLKDYVIVSSFIQIQQYIYFNPILIAEIGKLSYCLIWLNFCNCDVVVMDIYFKQRSYTNGTLFLASEESL